MPLSVQLLLLLLDDGLFSGLSSPPGLYLLGGSDCPILCCVHSTGLSVILGDTCAWRHYKHCTTKLDLRGNVGPAGKVLRGPRHSRPGTFTEL